MEKYSTGKVEKFLTDLQDSKVTALSDVKKPKDPVVVIEVFEKQNEKEISVAKLELFANGAGLALGTSNYLKGVWALPHKDLKQLNLTQEDFLESAPQKPEEKKS